MRGAREASFRFLKPCLASSATTTTTIAAVDHGSQSCQEGTAVHHHDHGYAPAHASAAAFPAPSTLIARLLNSVTGQSGTGRTTFVNTLCESEVLGRKETVAPELAHQEDGITITSQTVGTYPSLSFSLLPGPAWPDLAPVLMVHAWICRAGRGRRTYLAHRRRHSWLRRSNRQRIHVGFIIIPHFLFCISVAVGLTRWQCGPQIR